MKRLAMAAALLATACTDEEQPDEEQPTDRIVCNQEWPDPARPSTTVTVEYCSRACQPRPTYDDNTLCSWFEEDGTFEQVDFSFVDPVSGIRGVCLPESLDNPAEGILFHACLE